VAEHRKHAKFAGELNEHALKETKHHKTLPNDKKQETDGKMTSKKR
jgi:hypothetical protein